LSHRGPDYTGKIYPRFLDFRQPAGRGFRQNRLNNGFPDRNGRIFLRGPYKRGRGDRNRGRLLRRRRNRRKIRNRRNKRDNGRN
jgi:hypothetical protein